MNDVFLIVLNASLRGSWEANIFPLINLCRYCIASLMGLKPILMIRRYDT